MYSIPGRESDAGPDDSRNPTNDDYNDEPDEDTGCTAREMAGADLARHVFDLANAMNKAFAASVRREVA